jgi:hypothetical protein
MRRHEQYLNVSNSSPLGSILKAHETFCFSLLRLFSLVSCVIGVILLHGVNISYLINIIDGYMSNGDSQLKVFSNFSSLEPLEIRISLGRRITWANQEMFVFFIIRGSFTTFGCG